MEEEKKMSQEDIDEKLNRFFRFYDEKDCGFKETKPAYEKIVGAFAKAGILPEEYTQGTDGKPLSDAEILKKVTDKCKEVDEAEVIRTGGKVEENNIGLAGFLASLGYTEDNLGKDGLKKAYMQMGEKALNVLGGPGRIGDGRDQATIEAAAFLGELAAGPYFPRQTCFSASHFMSEGSIMQIGCSQGKTSVVAMTTYEQLMAGKKVFSTSSAPGLVPENYDEAKAFYDKMGISEQFCAISQNMETKKDHIVLFYSEKEGDPTTKYEITADGKILRQTEEYDEAKKENVTVMKEVEVTEELVTSLGLVSNEEGRLEFEESVKKMMAEKGIIMGDTITLGKYQDLMPERNKDGEISNSYLIVDEADAELLDTQPQEILGDQYKGKVAEDRWEDRKKAKLAIERFEGTPQQLEEYAKEVGLPLDFIVDAYEAKGFSKKDENGNPIQYTVKDKRVFILNPNTNVMIPASQGLSQAIIANDSELSEKHSEFPEMEVLGETDIPKLFSNFEKASLMSGTMQDKGMSDRSTEEQKKLYANARQVYLTRCGIGVALSAEKGVIDWKLVTPQTREEKGNVVVTTQGVKYNENPEPGKMELETVGETTEITSWREYLGNAEINRKLEENWRQAVQEETKRRSEAGQPVMVSVYGGRNPMDENVPVYTDKNQIGSPKNGTQDHKIKDDTCMFVDDGVGEIACFDDFYGRGYTFKFIEREDGKVKPQKAAKGGHVLITSLPDNSRNLEQFLFRVARGGDKGSSSIIISPNDPKLVGYLEKLEKEQGLEAANSYFQGVLSGKIDVMQIVVDIYPEQTQDLFHEKAAQIDATKTYEAYLAQELDHIRAVTEVGKAKSDGEGLKSFELAYRQEILKQSKLNRQAGVDTVGLVEQQGKLTKNAIINAKMQNPVEIVSVLPMGLSEEQLEMIIPDENIRSAVVQLIDKIDRYIARKNQVVKINVDEKENKPKEEQEAGRTTGSETYEATLEDPEYNLTEVEKTLVQIRESRGITVQQNTANKEQQDDLEK